ncbi:MAG TPA: hypothetical protein DIT13_00180 [Verrucomicrobiales bacterium]|nr:hypothetical protein [Verrucomicrobiales bacterium]HRJ10228.1 tail fiber domain-containing protein [Prosthecobacter sp.]HRK13293.1 tail fiber domain-containing protein [Prosthecobacter sp.]
MKNTHHLPLPLCLLILVILHSSLGLLHSQVPQLVSYQGRVAIGTVNFEGTGQFRFALVNAAGTTVYWGNAADTTPADGIPDSAVSLAVTKGLYSVLLGDTSLTNMAAIPASVWTNADVRLRVWFNDGVNGNQLLTPDQRLAPYGYLPDGSISTVKIATGAVDSSLLAANAVTGPKIASNAVNSAKLASNLTLGGTTTGTFSGNLTGNASTATNATSFTGALAGDVTGTQSATSIAAATVTGKALTGFSSTTGTITASDTILSAINKLNGNVALKAPIASPTFTGTVSGTFSGNGAALTNLNGANLTAGSIGGSQLAAASVTAAKLGTDVGLWSVSGANVFRSAGNVGIGTSSPGRALQVDGTSPAISIGSEFNGRTSLLMAVTAISGGYSIIQSTSSAGGSYGALSLQPNGGDVGIGTETPTAKLDVNGGINFSGIISGNGSALTNLNGGNLTAGTVTAAKLGTDVGTWAASGGNAYRTTGNVGIGTTTPSQPLTVAGNTHLGTGDNAALAFDGLGYGRLGFVKKSGANPVIAAGFEQPIVFSQSNQASVLTNVAGSTFTERMRIDYDGNVGIGATVPKGLLHVAGDYYGKGHLTLYAYEGDGVSGTAYIQGRDDSVGSSIGLQLRTQNAGAEVDALKIAPNGNVGIGTANPTHILDVNGVSQSQGLELRRVGIPPYLDFSSNLVDDFNARIIWQGAPVNRLDFDAPKFSFLNGTTSLHILPGEINGVASAGDVTLEIPGGHTLGIWDSLSVNNNLTVVGNSNMVGYAAVGVGGVPPNAALAVKKSASSHVTAAFLYETGTAVASIGSPTDALYVNVATGYARRSDDSPFWSVPSDRRLKTGIVQVTDALDTVSRLNPVRYHYTAERLAKMPGSVDKEHYGVIAQEYQKLFPQFVTTGADGYLSVQSDPLIFVATAAIKELNAKHDSAIAAKDAEIAALKKQLSSIDARLARLEATAPVKVAVKK